MKEDRYYDSFMPIFIVRAFNIIMSHLIICYDKFVLKIAYEEFSNVARFLWQIPKVSKIWTHMCMQNYHYTQNVCEKFHL